LLEVPDAPISEVPAAASAEAALAFIAEMSPDLRGAAILGGEGSVLAAGAESDSWAEDVAGLLVAADRAEGRPVEQVHVATEAGEVFAVREAGYVAVAVTERFALASLLFFDMRSALRRLSRGEDG
jgi:hypothetical protein